MAKRKKKRRTRLLLMLILMLFTALGIGVFSIGLRCLDKRLYPQKYKELVEQYSAENQIDSLLIFSVIRTESGFDPAAVSNVDARGLMQITDETFQWIKSKIAPSEEITFEDLYDPETNIRFGSYYFTRCMTRYHGDVKTAAAAYHSGWGTVDKLLANPEYSQDGQTLHTFPYKQMALYVQKIDRAYTRYQEIYSNTENEV